MPEIKIKEKPKGTIKQIDKSLVGVQKIKNNLVTTKEKVDEFTKSDDNNSGEEYAGRKVQNGISYVARKSIENANEIGKNSVKETEENFAKTKVKINNFKSKIKEKRADDLKRTIDNTNRMIKNNTKRTIKEVKVIIQLLVILYFLIGKTKVVIKMAGQIMLE